MWDKLPSDIVNKILLYDGQISYRNGKYINKIKDVDKKYPLIFDRMRLKKFRIQSNHEYIAIINIPCTTKHIFFFSSNNYSYYFINNYNDNDDYIRYPIFTY